MSDIDGGGIPQAFWSQHNLDQELTKELWNTPGRKVASDYLIQRLKAAGCRETMHSPGYFKHQSNSIIFALVVDDFFV
jgi:hypothetical protein